MIGGPPSSPAHGAKIPWLRTEKSIVKEEVVTPLPISKVELSFALEFFGEISIL